MDFIIPIVTGSAVKGRNLADFKVMNSIIQKDPDYHGGRYVENPKDALENVNKLQFLFAFSPTYYHEKFKSSKMLIQALDEQGMEGRKMDANDVVWRNEAAIPFNVEGELFKIKAKALIIGIKGDQFFPPELDAIPLSRAIKIQSCSYTGLYLDILVSMRLKRLKMQLKAFYPKCLNPKKFLTCP